jgi:hypothetical protein
MRLDHRNVNTLWGDAITLELTQIGDSNTFIDKGYQTKVNALYGYKKIRLNFVIDVKHDVRHKDMPVADSHLTRINVNLIYSSVVILKGFLPVLFLVKQNHLQIWYYAYLDAYTSEKLIIAFPDLPENSCDWTYSVYGNVRELLLTYDPEPLGDYVTLSHYGEASLMHDVTSGRSVTRILHLANKTPINWYSKKQATAETATFASKFVSARICVEQIKDVCNTVRYLGVPIRDKSFMFGDNKSVVDSSLTVHAKLHTRHTMLSFHRVREAIASGMIGFYFIPGEINPADILSKHWGYAQIWPQLKALLFWKGNTEEIQH